MTRVLIDTCAWIDFFKSKTGALGNLVAELIETNQAAITGVVIVELLQGVGKGKPAATRIVSLDLLFANRR